MFKNIKHKSPLYKCDNAHWKNQSAVHTGKLWSRGRRWVWLGLLWVAPTKLQLTLVCIGTVCTMGRIRLDCNIH